MTYLCISYNVEFLYAQCINLIKELYVSEREKIHRSAWQLGSWHSCRRHLTYTTHLNFVADQVHPLAVLSNGNDPPKQDNEPFYCKNCSRMNQRM